MSDVLWIPLDLIVDLQAAVYERSDAFIAALNLCQPAFRSLPPDDG